MMTTVKRERERDVSGESFFTSVLSVSCSHNSFPEKEVRAEKAGNQGRGMRTVTLESPSVPSPLPSVSPSSISIQRLLPHSHCRMQYISLFRR